MTVEQLAADLREHWSEIRQALLHCSYQPMAVRRVEIPKPSGGGRRQLGIPTVLDRFIQQAVLQVLHRYLDPTFSEQSYGFVRDVRRIRR
jgi:RNA-directed DNA polymerase